MRGELRAHDAEQAAWLAAGVLRVAGENPTLTSASATAAKCMLRCQVPLRSFFTFEIADEVLQTSRFNTLLGRPDGW
jgi:hypothetical protein